MLSGFKRLSLKQSVGLKHAGLILTVDQVKKAVDGSVTELIVSHEMMDEANKPKVCPLVSRYSTLTFWAA